VGQPDTPASEETAFAAGHASATAEQASTDATVAEAVAVDAQDRAAAAEAVAFDARAAVEDLRAHVDTRIDGLRDDVIAAIDKSRESAPAEPPAAPAPEKREAAPAAEQSRSEPPAERGYGNPGWFKR
jgi:hypothetical protein